VLYATDAFGRAVAVLAFGGLAVNLHQLRIVNVAPKNLCPAGARTLQEEGCLNAGCGDAIADAIRRTPR
jgi:hypothetical protein